MWSIILDKQGDSNAIRMNAATFNETKIRSSTIELHYGFYSKKLKLLIDKQVGDRDIVIPTKLSEQITIYDLPYECYFEGNKLIVGPVIGFFPEYQYYKNPQKMLMRFSKYDEIKGLIFIFRPSTINYFKKTIAGYYFEPNTKQFIKGIFPFPNALFSRMNIVKNMYLHFEKYLCKQIFNYPSNLDKLTFWNLLSQDPQLKQHLPATTEYTNLENLLKMLMDHQTLYLKPYNLSRGSGIMRLSKNKNGYSLKNVVNKTVHLKTDGEVSNFLQKKLIGRYLIQQEIEGLYPKKKVDFRVYFHKGLNKKWYLSGMETKVSKEGSIISNFKNRVDMFQGEVALQQLYHLSPHEINEMKSQISNLGIRALNLIEKSGFKLGEVAIDLIIDKDLKIWFLEVQVIFAAEKKLIRGKEEQLVLPEILPTPFQYAKALAGFTKEKMK